MAKEDLAMLSYDLQRGTAPLNRLRLLLSVAVAEFHAADEQLRRVEKLVNHSSTQVVDHSNVIQGINRPTSE